MLQQAAAALRQAQEPPVSKLAELLEGTRNEN